MPHPAWDNVDEFLDPDDFATVARAKPAGGQAFDLPGIFDELIMNVELGEYDMAEGRPRLEVHERYAPLLKKRDVLTIHGKDYFLDHDPHPNGTGTCILELGLLT
jgi:hypothetical protein